MAETKDRTVILNHKQIDQKITRIAHQIFENNFQEKSVSVMGIHGEGYVLAEKLVKTLNQIADFEIQLFGIHMDKKAPLKSGLNSEIESKDLKNKVVILVDDVLNSGKTLIYATKFLLDYNVKSIQTVCLGDRKHRKFPVRADYVGLTLSTTLQEHISVEFGKESIVYLD
jgi:pyrimidine operon attenuation protein/uracil phosphoribosyltransferase